MTERSTSVLLYNPRAGRWSTAALVDAIAAELTAGGIETEAVATAAPGHATEIAREAAERGAPTVFAFGGDGTLREAATGLLGSRTAMGPLPGGTTNVVARAIGLPLHPVEAARALAICRPRPVDVGLCGDRPFLMQLSIGLDAHILERVNTKLKRWLGKAAVGIAGVLELPRYGFPEIELIADGHPVQAHFAAVANLALYAGSFELVPPARIDDGRLWLLVFSGNTARATIRFAVDLARARHLDRDDVKLFAVERVELTARSNLVQLDGDVLTVGPVVVSMAQEKLLLLRPDPGES